MAIPDVTSLVNFDQRDGLTADGVLLGAAAQALLSAPTLLPLRITFFLPFTRGLASCTVILFDPVTALAFLRTDRSNGGRGSSGSM